MKKTLATLVTLLMILTLVMTVSAKGKVFTGVVLSYDKANLLSAKDLSVNDKEVIEEFAIAESKFGEGCTLDSIKAGDIVEIEFEERDGKKVPLLVLLKQGDPAEKSSAQEAQAEPQASPAEQAPNKIEN